MRVCGARSWTPQGCIRKTDRYRAVLVAWWVSVARALTMPPTHCGPVISLHPCRCGAIVIVDVVCCGPVAIPAVGVHACARAIRSDPDGWDAAAVLQGVGHQIVQNPLQLITLAQHGASVFDHFQSRLPSTRLELRNMRQERVFRQRCHGDGRKGQLQVRVTGLRILKQLVEQLDGAIDTRCR